MSAFLGSHDRISGLFLLNPENVRNRRNLKNISKEVAIMGIEVPERGGPLNLTTMAWACESVFWGQVNQMRPLL
jgi:hypothetical protein